MHTFSESTSERSGAPAPPRQPATAGTVVMVDDDETLLKALALLMERAGYAVHTASSGQEACALIHNLAGQLDAVVSDVSMPDGDGLDVMRCAHRQDPSLPVLLMTGVPSVETAIEALEAGAFKFLTKPVAPADLLEAVKKAVSTRGDLHLNEGALSRTPASRARSELERLFDSALEQLWMAFQPVVDLQARRVFAYEALVRSREPELARPDLLFDAAETLGRVHDIGRRIRRAICQRIPSAPTDCKIFVNLHPMDLADDALYDAKEPLAPYASRVVFEITERISLSKLADVEDRISALRARGYSIAVDDLGEGYAALKSMTQLKPEIVKLDMSLVRDIDSDDMKQRLVAAVAALCDSMNIKMVAEGVETLQELNTLVKLGMPLLQGYYFARPQEGFAHVEL